MKLDGAELWRLLSSHSGISQRGHPLSENRAPASDIAPWVARVVSAKATNEPTTLIDCGMCNDLAYTRYIINGHWTAQTADGQGAYRNEVLQFGQHSKFMPLTCRGDIMSAGFGLRAGAFYALTGRKAVEIVDRIEQTDIFGLLAPDLRDIFSDQHSPSEWSAAMEEALRRYITRLDPDPPDPISIAFEIATFADPTQNLTEFAEMHDISLRQLERIVKRDFGLTPKKVMRRARALDLASQLCGVTDNEEEDEIILRYFDQSHLIREFASFFGVTPRNFRSRVRPILTISLEQRQGRRLHDLNRVDADGKMPWRAD